MTNELVPGLDHIDIHEARLTGPFDLLRADLTQIRVGARVMVCVVADVVLPMTFAETKDGDVKAKWTLKPIDVALVREEGMRQHLSSALNMIGVDGDEYKEEEDETFGQRTLVGQYDEEGAFLGFEAEEDPETLSTELIGEGDEEEEDAPTLFRKSGPKPQTQAAGPVENVETFGQPVKHDKHLSNFLDERVPA